MKKHDEKLRKLANALYIASDLRGHIKRHELRRVIMWTLEISDAHTVNNWIDVLLGKRLISYAYPKSALQKPYRNTLYIINVKECGMLIYGSLSST